MKKEITKKNDFTAILTKKLLSNEKNKVILNGFLRFAGGFLFSRLLILGEYSPFGVAFAAANGGMTGGLFATFGVILGYASLFSKIDSLKYLTAVFIILTAWYVIKSTKVLHSRFIPPALCLLSIGSVGFAFAAGHNFGQSYMTGYFAELALSAGGAFFFRGALEIKNRTALSNEHNRLCMLVFISILLACISQITTVAYISVGHLIGIITLLYFVSENGIFSGAAAGLILGLAMDVVSGKPPVFIILYSFSALFSAIFFEKSRFFGIVAFVMANGLAAAWINSSSAVISLYEVFAGSVVFYMLPPQLGTFFAGSLSVPAQEKGNEHRLINYVNTRLKRIAGIYNEVNETLSGELIRTRRRADEEISQVYRIAGKKICGDCNYAERCWQTNLNDTNKMFKDIFKQSNISNVNITDFPQDFIEKCLSADKLMKEINDELYRYNFRRRYKNDLKNNREILCTQYDEISRLVSNVSGEFSENILFDDRLEAEISDYMKRLDITCTVMVYYSAGKINIELEGTSLEKITDIEQKTLITDAFTKITSRSIALPEQIFSTHFNRLIFTELCKNNFQIASAGKKHKSSAVSGDFGTYFKLQDGRLIVILSDGMGTGRPAAAESTYAVKLLERFIKIGMEPLHAIKTVTSALVLKNGTALFSTVDLLEINLNTCDATFYKCGAAPSYHKSKDATIKFFEPITLTESGINLKIATHKIRLAKGDIVYLVTDGVSDGSDDDWLINFDYSKTELNLREAAVDILEEAAKHSTDDDMTVIAVMIT